MNILLENGLPEEIDGYKLYTDFRNMIRLEIILDDDSLSEYEKVYLGLSQLFEQIPSDVNYAIDRLMWFYSCGTEKKQSDGREKSGDRAYDFNVDAPHIYAAFYYAYGIDLIRVEYMHWWQFASLLAGLPEDTHMAKLMQYRTMDLSDIEDKGQHKFYAAMKKKYALKKKTVALTAEEAAEQYKAKIARRFAQAKTASNNV